MYVPTKAGELLRLTPELAKAGFRRVPFGLIKPPFEPKLDDIRVMMQVMKAYSKPDGPFLPYVMFRNNGRPEGTGEGRSEPDCFGHGGRHYLWRLNDIQKSDANAKGVIMQPFVGQKLFELDEATSLCGPHLSGIAYTKAATERGNAIVEWVYGHPAGAVAGYGNYVAFDENSIGSESDNLKIYSKDKMIFALKDCNRGSNDRKVEIAQEKISEGIGHGINDVALLGKVMEAVLRFGENGAYYLEWALTKIAGNASLFALQASEFSGKLAGLPTWMHTALQNFGVHDKERLNDDADLRRLKRLYEEAVGDPAVLAAGFDTVGTGKKTFSRLAWKPLDNELMYLPSEPFIIAYTMDISPQTVIKEVMERDLNDGFVELSRIAAHNPLRGHAAGYGLSHDVLGLGGVEDMSHKLEAIVPEGFQRYGNAIIEGKFVLEVDSRIPFGTLRVERVDCSSPLRRE